MKVLEIQATGEKCLCDFTFDFYWQHQGSRLDPHKAISGVSLCQMVEALRQGETIKILGDVGSRLGSSLGVDLVRLGGKGGPIDSTGSIVVDGHVGSRMGISMLRGAIYVSGKVEPPFGNVVEVASDRSGFQKFISVTEALEKSIPVLEPNLLDRKGLRIRDCIPRDTLGARNSTERSICLEGDAGMSTGILMQGGEIRVLGDAGQNTGVLLRGGRIVVKGRTCDFTGAEMRGGEIYVEADAGNFTCAKMSGGIVFARDAKPLPPAKARSLSSSEQTNLARALEISPPYAMMYRKFSL